VSNICNYAVLSIILISLLAAGNVSAAPFPDRPLLAGTESCDSAIERSSSGMELGSSRYKSGTLAFNASYQAGTWTGDLIATDITTGTIHWRLSDTFSGINTNFKDRTILKGFSGFTAHPQMADLSGTPNAMDVFNYLRGDQSNEDGVVFRIRNYPIGDIVHSTPAYAPATTSGNSSMVYVGANDGMLHGIDADTGKVSFSYIPKGVDVETLTALREPNYEHRFFVDGFIDVMPPSQFSDKTFLVGAMGRGGRGTFGLDVSDPGNITFLFDDTIPLSDTRSSVDMGYVLGPVHVRPIRNTTTSLTNQSLRIAVFIPNGIDSPSGEAKLIIRLLRGDGGSPPGAAAWATDGSKSNGLMALALADMDGDGSVDRIYGGDLKGNIWVWDMGSGYMKGMIPGQTFTQARKVFEGDPSRPISGLAAARRTDGKVMLGFGTGSYIFEKDRNSTSSQRLYGIIDDGQTTIKQADLTRRSLNAPNAVPVLDVYQELPATSQGWYIDLAIPERVTHAPVIISSGMYVNLVSPPATSGLRCDQVGPGHTRTVAVNIFTGTAAPQETPYFPASQTDGIVSEGMATTLRALSDDTENGKTYLMTNMGALALPKPVEGFDFGKTLKGGRFQWREILR